MSFTENLYLKRMIQQLQEENLKLKSLLNEIDSFEADRLRDDHLSLHHPGSGFYPQQNLTPPDDFFTRELHSPPKPAGPQKRYRPGPPPMETPKPYRPIPPYDPRYRPQPKPGPYRPRGPLDPFPEKPENLNM
jgi:hypothetical protein